MTYKMSAAILFLAFTSCASKNQIAQTINDNPEIIYDAIKKNPKKFMEAVRIAAQSAQQNAYADQEKEAQEMLEKDFKNPRQVKIDVKRILAGPEDAPITIIKYADFQCPACRMGYNSLEKVKDKYKDKVRFIHKNVPLQMHPLAPLAAEIYEALLLTDKAKARAFYNKTYSEQGQWGSEKDLWALCKKVGGDKKRLQSIIAKGGIKSSIAEDVEEHRAQGFEGTPAYIINGVALYGAQSEKEFEAIIDRHLKK